MDARIHPCAFWRVLSAIPSRESACWATSFRILDVGTGQCVCAFEFERVFRNAEVILVDLLTAHIKFCRFWPKYLNGVLRGLTVRQPLGAYIRTSPSSSHQRCLHAAQRTIVNSEFLRPPPGSGPGSGRGHQPRSSGRPSARGRGRGSFWQYEFATSQWVSMVHGSTATGSVPLILALGVRPFWVWGSVLRGRSHYSTHC